ncbi:MAG: Na+/H+ antiporter NhaC family protein [Muribaculaceae bacterium]|nr:Na+/H+ antiporter NhaC family protein [Muribaculaceae bacterium]
MSQKTRLSQIPARRGLLAISPIVVFILFYLVVSLAIGDFYKMPISVALMVASVWAALIMRGTPLNRRVEMFSSEAGSVNVMYMVWVFVLAGAFSAIAKATGAVDATVALALNNLPPAMIVPGLFLATCFISLSIGTSVGTVVALTPLAVGMAGEASGHVAFYVAIVLGGAFFGDNLSFISDTTIAATRTQGCDMKDKFKANVWIVVPAAIIALVIYSLTGPRPDGTVDVAGGSPWLVTPYLVVIACALSGINVTVVLLLGIVAAMSTGLATGHSLLDLFGMAGEGIASMGELIIITLLAAGMLGLIKAAGGIDYLIQLLTRHIHGPRGAQAGIAVLVALVNFCTANNTVAIITAGPLARRISTHYGVAPRKAASLLDTASCIVQALIPYGAQTLLATALAGIAPAAPWPYLLYPQILILAVILSVIIRRPQRNA